MRQVPSIFRDSSGTSFSRRGHWEGSQGEERESLHPTAAGCLFCLPLTGEQ